MASLVILVASIKKKLKVEELFITVIILSLSFSVIVSVKSF